MNLGLIFVYATPIIIAAIGGLYAERSGIVNIALEGIMLVGSFTAAIVAYYLGLNQVESTIYSVRLIPWISVIVGAIAGGVFSLLHAVASIKYRANQVISGTALNMLSLGLVVFLAEVLFNQQRTQPFRRGFSVMNLGFINDNETLSNIVGGIHSPFVLALVLIILTKFILDKTRFGLRLKACGEYPQAAASMGINVYKTRYIAVIISGVLAGLAGGILTLTVNIQSSASSINGVGFIALATLIFGQWKPMGVFLAGLFFGTMQVLAIVSGTINMFSEIPREIFIMLPYIITIIALVITSSKNRAPKASGEIYDEGKR